MLFITFIPLFFVNVIWLAIPPILLGLLEAVMHLAAIKMFNLPRFYSPGLVTAVFLMMPISIYTIVYVVENSLMHPLYWLYSLLYMMVELVVAQQIIVRMSGMKYSEFLKNVRAKIASK